MINFKLAHKNLLLYRHFMLENNACLNSESDVLRLVPTIHGFGRIRHGYLVYDARTIRISISELYEKASQQMCGSFKIIGKADSL
jgi:hypothetical protein